MSEFKIKLYQIVAGELEPAEVEQWINTESELQTLLAPDEYLELISLDYETAESLFKTKKILERYVAPEQYDEWIVRRLLLKIVERSLDVQKYIEQSYILYSDGFGFLDNLGLGYEIIVSDKWSEMKRSEQQKLIDGFYPAVVEEARKVLGWINTGKIMMINRAEDDRGIKYIDTRTANEKQPTGYRIP